LLPAAALKGVTLGGLRKLEVMVRQLHSSGFFSKKWISSDGKVSFPPVLTFEDLTTEQLVYRWVKSRDMTGDRRLADCPQHINPADLGVPSYFISHAWKGTFAKLLRTIYAFLANASESTRVWIDCIAINQHQDTAHSQNQADVGAFEEVLKTCRAGTVVVVDQVHCNPATRAWCLRVDDGLHK
jgi:hypothetical protein